MHVFFFFCILKRNRRLQKNAQNYFNQIKEFDGEAIGKWAGKTRMMWNASWMDTFKKLKLKNFLAVYNKIIYALTSSKITLSTKISRNNVYLNETDRMTAVNRIYIWSIE